MLDSYKLFNDNYKSLEDAHNDCEYTSQAEALQFMLKGYTVCLGGLAGAGKSEVIKRFISLKEQEADEKDMISQVIVTSTTGVSATLINGVTLHSATGLGINTETTEEEWDNIRKFYFKKLTKIAYADTLIIDEISMLSADQLDKLDWILRQVGDSTRHKNDRKETGKAIPMGKRVSNKPFGGLQVIFVGDLLQLPPVKGKYLFFANSWKEANVKPLFLDKLQRADEQRLTMILECIANRDTDNPKLKQYILEMLNNKKDESKVYTKLFCTNRNVDSLNRSMQHNNPNRPEAYITYSKIFQPKKLNDYDIEKHMKQWNIPECLVFKPDDIVMVTENLGSHLDDLKNGDIGKVVEVHPECVDVRFNKATDEIISIPYTIRAIEGEKIIEKDEDGKIIRNEREQLGALIYIPLKLAYAITVHKSQGQTFDGVELDLSDVFGKGLGYVALSRVRSVNDIIFKSIPKPGFLSIDDDSYKFMKEFKEQVKAEREENLKLLS